MMRSFATGFASSLGGQAKWDNEPGVVRITSNAIVGGTVSVIGGGKFANGAITGAYTVMLNDMMHELGDDPSKKKNSNSLTKEKLLSLGYKYLSPEDAKTFLGGTPKSLDFAVGGAGIYDFVKSLVAKTSPLIGFISTCYQLKSWITNSQFSNVYDAYVEEKSLQGVYLKMSYTPSLYNAQTGMTTYDFYDAKTFKYLGAVRF